MDLETLNRVHSPRFITVLTGWIFKWPLGHYLVLSPTIDEAIQIIGKKRRFATHQDKDEFVSSIKQKCWLERVPSRIMVFDAVLPEHGEILREFKGTHLAKIAIGPSGSAALVMFTGSPPDVYLGNEMAELFNVPGLADAWVQRHGLMLVSDIEDGNEM